VIPERIIFVSRSITVYGCRPLRSSDSDFYTFSKPVHFGVCTLCLSECNKYVICSEQFDSVLFGFMVI